MALFIGSFVTTPFQTILPLVQNSDGLRNQQRIFLFSYFGGLDALLLRDSTPDDKSSHEEKGAT